MAMSNTAKLGLSAGAGVATTMVVDAALMYFTSPKNEEGDDNWYYQYSSLLGGAASVVTGAILWKMVGKEEGVVCMVAGLGTALFVPARAWIDEKAVERRTSGRPAGRPAQLPAAVNQATVGAVRDMAAAGVRR